MLKLWRRSHKESQLLFQHQNCRMTKLIKSIADFVAAMMICSRRYLLNAICTFCSARVGLELPINFASRRSVGALSVMKRCWTRLSETVQDPMMKTSIDLLEMNPIVNHQQQNLNLTSPGSFIVQLRVWHSSDGRVIRASASVAVHLGLIPSRVKPMTSKLVFTASLLDAQH